MSCRFFLVLLGSLCSAQSPRLGVIGGVNLTDDIQSVNQTYPGANGSTQTTIVTAAARRAILGIVLEQRLSHHWAVEADALHHEVRSISKYLISPPLQLQDGTSIGQFGPYTRTLTTWEFPVLAKYQLAGERFFLTGGPSFRPAGTGTGLSHVGGTAGLGAEFWTGRYRISPTIRFTRWKQGIGDPAAAPNLNQVELLVGFDRPGASRGVTAFGRTLIVGAIAGIGIGEDFQVGRLVSQKPESNSGIFGASAEIPLNANFTIEADAMYRPLHGTMPEGNRSVRFAHLTWEFPVLAKYTFAESRRWRPFVEGGPSFRAEGNLNLQSGSWYGATFGAGLSTRLHRLRLSPTLRYTRWGNAGDTVRSRTQVNQVQLLVGVSY